MENKIIINTALKTITAFVILIDGSIRIKTISLSENDLDFANGVTVDLSRKILKQFFFKDSNNLYPAKLRYSVLLAP